jgi:hypothetical protein
VNIANLVPRDKNRAVYYTPYHARGDKNHPDIEMGYISSWNASTIFVRYTHNSGLPPQGTDPEDLAFVNPLPRDKAHDNSTPP